MYTARPRGFSTAVFFSAFGPFVGWLVGGAFPCGEILGSRERSKSHPLATIPRYRCDYPPWGGAKIQLRTVPMRLGPVESGGACYRELPRIILSRSWVNKDIKKPRLLDPGPPLSNTDPSSS